MASKKNKRQIIEYKSSTWKTEIKGDLNNPTVKNMIVSDFVLRWIVRSVLVLLTVYRIVCHYLP